MTTAVREPATVTVTYKLPRDLQRSIEKRHREVKLATGRDSTRAEFVEALLWWALSNRGAQFGPTEAI